MEGSKGGGGGLVAREPAADHVAGDAAGEVGGAEGAAGEVGGLAELVAAGEGERVHDGQDEGDDCCEAGGQHRKHEPPEGDGRLGGGRAKEKGKKKTLGKTSKELGSHSPTRGSHRNCRRTRARMAMTTHSTGWT